MRFWQSMKLGTQVTCGFVIMSSMLAVGGAIGVLSSRQVGSHIDEMVERQTKVLKPMLNVNCEVTERTAIVRELSTQTATIQARAAGEYRALAIFMTVATAFAVGFGMLLAWGITKRATGPIRSGVETLSTTASELESTSAQVAAAAQNLSNGASDQAASLEQASASMEEMSSMTKRNAESARSAATVVGDVDTRVHESKSVLHELVDSIASMQESSRRVATIIKAIDEIAFQTNILALNAAVEAARAGDAGMGFAVVANEVRSLAQRSAQAARDTAGLIEESIARTEKGGATVQHVVSSFTAINDGVTELKTLVESVTAASREQAQGFDQVTQAIQQMERVTQQNAATAEESAIASEQLSIQAQSAARAIVDLEQLVGSRSGRPGGASADHPDVSHPLAA